MTDKLRTAALAQPVEQEPLMEPDGRCRWCLTYNGHQDGCLDAPKPDKPAEQKPVAYVCWGNPKNADGTLSNFSAWLSHKPEGYVCQPLTTPQNKQEWQGLTDDERNELGKEAIKFNWNDDYAEAIDFVVGKIEAKLKEKNT